MQTVEINSFEDIFAAFGGPAALGREAGIKTRHANTMKVRRSIPPAYWPGVVRAASRLGIIGVTVDKLAEISAARRVHTHADVAA